MPGKAKDKKAKNSSPKKSSAVARAAAQSNKGGAIGSLKKILGLNTKKGASNSSKATSIKAPAKAAGKKTNGLAKPAASSVKSVGAAKKTMPKSNPGAALKAAKPAKPAANAKTLAKAAPESKGKRVAGSKHGGNGLENSLTTLSLSDRGSARSEPVTTSGAAVCREVACELVATTGDYCRMHYIKNWKKIKRKQMILKERKLNHYIEELVSKYPDKYIEAIRQDLASEKDFAKVIADLEIEETLDDFESVETESAEGIIDNLKRDFEDEGDVF